MRVLVTGATGFVGGCLWPALERAGHQVVGLTRSLGPAQQRWPGRAWLEGNVGDRAAMSAALAGCDAVYYLVHGMSEGEVDYRRAEVEAARSFALAAAEKGVQRIVYLGGMAPKGSASEHLRSRLEVGQALRESPVTTVELRSSMIVGHGSLSWLMVRDLAARLPFMVLPRWLKSRTQPIAIDDVVHALVSALTLPVAAGEWFDIPGPETLSGREILDGAARAMGMKPPIAVEVPVLSPWLSSHWVHFVTRAEWAVAREVVVGLGEDMLARDDRFWEVIAHPHRVPFMEAARRALAAEGEAGPVSGAWGSIERWVAGVRRERRH